MISLDNQGISALDYAQNRGLYFCRSVFEVYLREKSNNGMNSRPSTTRSFNNNSIIKMNDYDVTPTPPVNGHATFIRRNGRQSLNESSSIANYSSPIPTNEPFSQTTNYSNRQNHEDEDEAEEQKDLIRHRHRPSSSTTTITNNSLIAPPVKPRKTSTTPKNALVNSSESKPNHRHHLVMTATYSDDDDSGEGDSLKGHGNESDFDDDQVPTYERPTSRLSVHNDTEDHFPQQSNSRLRRPHNKQAKQSNRNSAYDDFRFLDEQQQQASPTKSKQHPRSTTNKEFPQPSSNRVGSGRHPLVASFEILFARQPLDQVLEWIRSNLI